MTYNVHWIKSIFFDFEPKSLIMYVNNFSYYIGGVFMECNTYKIYDQDDIGEVRITEDVLAIIAGLAATEVEGVDSLADNITNEIIAKLGKKNLSAGVRVTCTDNVVSVSLSIVIGMGSSIPEVSKNVQEKVTGAIESMTGLTVNSVDIKIASVKA